MTDLELERDALATSLEREIRRNADLADEIATLRRDLAQAQADLATFRAAAMGAGPVTP